MQMSDPNENQSESYAAHELEPKLQTLQSTTQQ